MTQADMAAFCGCLDCDEYESDGWVAVDDGDESPSGLCRACTDSGCQVDEPCQFGEVG